MKLSPFEEVSSSDPESEIVSGEIGAFDFCFDFDGFEAGFLTCFLVVARLGAIAKEFVMNEKTEKSKTKNDRKIMQWGFYIVMPGAMLNTEYTDSAQLEAQRSIRSTALH